VAAESVEALLRSLFDNTGEGAVEAYAQGTGTAARLGDSLESIVRRHLAAVGKTSQLRESLEATIRAGGGVGESVEQMLLKTGLTGWT
jgi:hypothetical protein